MTDKINNWYSKLPKDLERKPKIDKNFKHHHILPCSMILAIGGTGCGKTNALVDFLSRKNEAFYKIIIFSGSSTDEPLYNFIQQQIPEVEIYNDIAELPELTTFDDEDKEQEKLIIFDDFINLKKPEMKKINEYLTAGRKMGFTCWLMAQNYVSVPKTITRNCHYFIVFRLNDNTSINNIIKNHNIDNIEKEVFKNAYIQATSQPRDFFMVDLKGEGVKRLRHNFLDFYRL
jgi:Poxvirus A32 protein